MELKLSILADDTVDRPDLLGEHGYSLYIETGEQTILFDTGQGMVLHHNARQLGINLCEQEIIVLSHGHYDHANGVRVLLCNPRLEIYAHPAIMKPKFKQDEDGTYRDIGIDWFDNGMIVNKIKWHLSEEPVHLSDAIVLSGRIPRVTEFENVEPHFCVHDEHGGYTHDIIPDDQAIYIRTASGLVILTGCAHSGIVNTVLHAREVMQTDSIRCLVGGMHLINASEEKITKTVQYLKSLNISEIHAAHCTGFDASCALRQMMPETFHLVHAGKVLDIAD